MQNPAPLPPCEDVAGGAHALEPQGDGRGALDNGAQTGTAYFAPR
jgi:hypothetical protein